MHRSVSAGVRTLARMEGEESSNTGSPVGGVARVNRKPREGQSGPAGWRMGPYYLGGRVMPAEGRGPGSRAVWKGSKA